MALDDKTLRARLSALINGWRADADNTLVTDDDYDASAVQAATMVMLLRGCADEVEGILNERR